MKIAVAGIGYVGLSMAILLSQANEVTAVDVVPEKVAMINGKKSPIVDKEIEEYLATRELKLTATVDGRKIKVFPLMQSHSSAEAWAGGKAIARASENPFTLMAMSTQECEDGKTAYLVASASTEFASEALMQSTGAGNSKTLMGIIRYMGKDNAPVELVYRPFGSTEMAGITTRTANILTVTLTAIPALICLVWGTVVLIRRKNV